MHRSHQHDRELARKVAASGQRSVQIPGTRGGIQKLDWREREYLRQLAERMEEESDA